LQTGLLEIASHLDAIDLSKLAKWASKILGLSPGDFKKSAQQIASKRRLEERARKRAEREAAKENKEAESSAAAADSSGIQEVEPWPQPVNLSQVLSETVAVFRRYIWMSESQAVVVLRQLLGTGAG
jgi:hypothetical protein